MSNFVFSRRSLQQSINNLALILKHEQLVSLVDRLNRLDDGRLPAMWELVMLNALAGVGELRHEVELHNGRCPDIELTVTPVDGEPFMVIGDVASVSDAGLDEQNPVGVLSTELNRLVAKAELNPHHFGYDVRGEREGLYGDSRVKLLLPNKGALLALMGREVLPWIYRIKAAPHQSNSIDFSSADTNFSLTYDPTQRYARGGHLSYDVAASREKNPLYRALKGKVDQLKQAPSAAIRLIIACDGDCALLRQSSLMGSPGTFSAREVAENFLRKNSSIDAVLLVTIDEQRQVLASKTTCRMKYDLVVGPPQTRSCRMTPVAIAALETTLREGLQRIPTPVLSAYNAVARCRTQKVGPDMIGGFRMTNGEISLSSRALQRLLAGEISSSDFLAAHDWTHGSHFINPFASAMASGQMISKVEVRSADESDDDWLTFSFGQPDPAAGPFKVPPKD